MTPSEAPDVNPPCVTSTSTSCPIFARNFLRLSATPC